MKSYTFIIFAFLIFSTTACNKDNPDPTQKQPKHIQLSGMASEVIQGSNHFGMELFKAVALEDTDNNVMLSPLSASTALTMLLNGCNGETYTQIRDMLGFKNMSAEEINTAYNSLVTQLLSADEEVNLALANSVWYRNQFQIHQNYLDIMNNDFDSHIEGLDFNHPDALETINNWASDNTNGKIPKVLDEISGNAVMFLMNALYFKGIWTEKFNSDLTQNASFTLNDGTIIETPMMKSEIASKVFTAENYRALELFYGRKNFSMIIIVPDNGLSEFIESITPEIYNEIGAGFDAQPGLNDVSVSLPQFSFEYEKRLNDQLQGLGMEDAFNAAVADLSGISDVDLFVSFVKQNTFIEVNEEGTEAAAVTTIGIELTSLPGEEFIVNKPFVFAIREQTTNTILFIGQVVEP